MYVEGGAGRGERLFLAGITLCELVWVLESAYGYGRTEIVLTLEQISRTADFELEHAEYVRAAMVLYRDPTADFSDALVGEINHAAGCETTVTFDKGLKRLTRFRALDQRSAAAPAMRYMPTTVADVEFELADQACRAIDLDRAPPGANHRGSHR